MILPLISSRLFEWRPRVARADTCTLRSSCRSMEETPRLCPFCQAPTSSAIRARPSPSPLRHPRLAFTLGQQVVSSAFVADIHETPRWAHGIGASYLLSGHPTDNELRRFELIEDGSTSRSTLSAHPIASRLSFPQSDFSFHL